jgi:hypothetical protein
MKAEWVLVNVGPAAPWIGLDLDMTQMAQPAGFQVEAPGGDVGDLLGAAPELRKRNAATVMVDG